MGIEKVFFIYKQQSDVFLLYERRVGLYGYEPMDEPCQTIHYGDMLFNLLPQSIEKINNDEWAMISIEVKNIE